METGEIDRIRSCKNRLSNRSCSLVNKELGWISGMELSDCDKCFFAGIYTSEAAICRGEYCKNRIDFITQRLVSATYPDIIVKELLSRHLDVQTAKNIFEIIKKDYKQEFVEELSKIIEERSIKNEPASEFPI